MRPFTLVVFAIVMASCAPVTRLAPDDSVAFEVWEPGQGGQAQPIVLQYDVTAGTGANWPDVNHPQWYEGTMPILMGRAANYLREGLKRMTGHDFAVVSTSNLSSGIVLTLLKGATADIRNDPEVKHALREMPGDAYSDKEAFFIRSETNRTLVVANTADGLLSAVVELLESVDYEILGMGPNWTHSPDYRNRPLVFSIKRAGRPSFYIRSLVPTSGQSYGVGTIMSGLSNNVDETVDTSNWRWHIGARLYGKSMPPFPGHAMQGYHKPVLKEIRDKRLTEGFLVPRIVVAPDVQRPAATNENAGWLWLNDDTAGQPGADKVFVSDGKTWVAQTPGYADCNLDLSVPFVRQIVFAEMTNQAANSFAKTPDDLVIFGMDAEDGGGYAVLEKLMKYKQWYPEYRTKEGIPLGQPYVLHGYNGLNQPREIWDPGAASDTMFGCANWLLREFDKWIDSLPEAGRVTASGTPKKSLIRCSFYSYNYHDVPPNFNLDPRIRVMIASYPKHRGHGKWEKFASQEDMARAFKVMLPREPSGDYRIISLAYYWDPGPSGIPAQWSASPKAIAEDYRRAYDAGYRAISIETDYNFGKFGLAYYLISKIFWNAELTANDLDRIRDTWFRRAFGEAWKEAKAYYDFMLTENFTVNGPNSWAKAIRLIDAASVKLEAAGGSDALKRIDDLKQYWYYHYLMDSGKYTVQSPEVKEYLWKGQMSYMVAMHVLARRDFGTDNVRSAVGTNIAAGPAHYTHAETQQWWVKVLDHWKVTPVAMFQDAVLSDGTKASAVDMNDLVMVMEFQGGAVDSPFIYNSGYMKPVPFMMAATKKDDLLGFKLVWPFNPNDNYYVAKKLPYGVDVWDAVRKSWEPWIDKTMIFQQSVEVTTDRSNKVQVAEVVLRAPRPGTYRFDIGYGGNAASLASFVYDPVTAKYGSNSVSFTYYTGTEGLTQSPVYVYIPKGTKSVDLEVWDNYKGKFLHLYRGLPAAKQEVSRKIEISEMGTHTIALQPGEDGTVAMLQSNGFAFPYLYSIPTLWAKSPRALLVPRAIAKSDGLTVME